MKYKLLLAALLAGLMMGTAGCKEKGPMEKAGEKLDHAAEEVEEAAEEVAEEVKDKSGG